jgi:hypothetical protein
VTTDGRLPSAKERDGARTVALDPEVASVAAVVRALPDPDELEGGTLVILPAEAGGRRSLARTVLAAFGRTRTISRALRCTALVARGYVDVGAGVDPDTRADLAWGYVPVADDKAATEPC